MKTNGAPMRMAAVALLALSLGCRRAATPDTSGTPNTPAVAGRWQRVDQASEWIELAGDGSFRSHSFMGTEVAGRYTQQGGKVTLTPLPEGHGATLTLADTLLVMEEGTRYRRAAAP